MIFVEEDAVIVEEDVVGVAVAVVVAVAVEGTINSLENGAWMTITVQENA